MPRHIHKVLALGSSASAGPAVLTADRNASTMRLPVLSVLLFALVLTAGHRAVYSTRIDLSGDQTTQVIAAEALLKERRYLVPLHHTQAHAVTVVAGADYRQPLRWFPPGYSIALYLVTSITGLSLSESALAVFYVIRFVWAGLWMAAACALGIGSVVAGTAILFCTILTYPSTTTDIFESAVTASLFLAVSRCLPPRPALLFGSLCCISGIAFRYAAVKLAGFWAVYVLWRYRGTHIPRHWVYLSAGLPALSYVLLTVVLGPAYAGVSSAPATNWSLIAKGFYYALIGGFSPVSGPFKAIMVLVTVLVMIWCARRAMLRDLPQWCSYLLLFQLGCILFLVLVQTRYSGMYSAAEPAFATARFYALAQPLNVAMMITAARSSLPGWMGKMVMISLCVFLSSVAVERIYANHAILAKLAVGRDGFLRESAVAAVHTALQQVTPNTVLTEADLAVYTGVDAMRIYPNTARTIVFHQPSRVAVVEYTKGSRSLTARMSRLAVLRETISCGTYKVAVFDVPAGVRVER